MVAALMEVGAVCFTGPRNKAVGLSTKGHSLVEKRNFIKSLSSLYTSYGKIVCLTLLAWFVSSSLDILFTWAPISTMPVPKGA